MGLGHNENFKGRSMFSREEKFLIFLLSLVQFTHIVDFMIVMPLGPTLMKELEISPAQFGLLVSSYTLCAGASGFFASLFLDRFDRKQSLIFFFSGFTIGTLLCGVSNQYASLLFFRSVTGAFGGILNALSMAIISDRIEYSRRGTAMGFLSTSFSVASIFGVPFSLFLANHFGWQSTFYFLGAIAALCAIALNWKVPSMRDHLAHRLEKNIFSPLQDILKNKTQINSLIFMFFLMFGHFTIIPFLSASLVANAGVQNQDLPLVYLFGGLCSMIFSPLLGRLSDRHGKHQVFTLSVLMSLLPIFLITHLSVNSLWVILSISSVFFILAGGRMIPAQAMISSLAPPQQRGSFMSVMSSVQQLTMATGSYIASLIVHKNEAGQLINYSLVGYIAMFSSLISMYLAWGIKTSEASKN